MCGFSEKNIIKREAKYCLLIVKGGSEHFTCKALAGEELLMSLYYMESAKKDHSPISCILRRYTRASCIWEALHQILARAFKIRITRSHFEARWSMLWTPVNLEFRGTLRNLNLFISRTSGNCTWTSICGSVFSVQKEFDRELITTVKKKFGKLKVVWLHLRRNDWCHTARSSAYCTTYTSDII